ncbi:hypothetical protein M3Y94_01224000 [Aphelenchoides besseyi]|nr:hypothetical protein M3Y94_01224000 [Aphelenchoides besseyi]KAI6219694.1 RRM domain-containing protein [Aphelenchoides besseyi]
MDPWQQQSYPQGGPPNQQAGPPNDAGGYQGYFADSGAPPQPQPLMAAMMPPRDQSRWGQAPPPMHNQPPPYGGGQAGVPPSGSYRDGGYNASYDMGGRGGNQSYSNNESSSGPPMPNKMVFVSGLPQHANETFIYDVFSAEGPIEINEANGKPKIKIYLDHGVSKGECTISFEDEASAQKVIDSMNGRPFPGSENILSLSFAKFSGNSGRGRGGGRGFGGRGRGGFNDRGDSGRGGGSYRGGSRDGNYDSRPRGGGRFNGGQNDYEQRGGYRNDDRGDYGRGGGSSAYRGRDRNDDRGRPPYGQDGGSYNRNFDDRPRGGGGFRGGSGNSSYRGSRDGNFDSRPRGGFRGGRGGGNSREGDWDCSCGNNNFAFRTECNSCKQPRADGGGNGGGQMRGPPRSNDRHRPY